MDVEDNTPKSEPAHIQQEDSARDNNDASSIKSLSNLSLSNMDIPSNKIDLESRKNSKENRDLVEYFHSANDNFIESLREYAKDRVENPKMIQKDVISSFHTLQAELKNKEIKGDSLKKEENVDKNADKNDNKNDNKNVDTTEAILNSLVEECEKSHDDDDDDNDDDDYDDDTDRNYGLDSDDSAEERETITYIDDFLILITEKARINDWPDIIKYRLNIISSLSKRKYIALYMMENNILQKILAKAHPRSELVEIIFSTILNINQLFDEIIDWIGSNKEFVALILDQLKSTNDLVLINLMKILKLAIYSIQTNRFSRWLINLKEYEPFAYQIIVLFRLQFNETLITEATDLLKDMVKTKMSNQPPVLQQLFNDKILDLIPVLMMSCTQMLINKKKSVDPINSEYNYNWLTIMMAVKSHLAIAFEKTEEKEKYILLKILIVLLHPYQKASSFFPGRKLKQDLRMIFKSMCLLSYIHRHFYIPMIMDRTLMRIILNLQAVITDDMMDFEEEEEGVEIQELMRKLLSYLRDLWGNTIQCRNSASIEELWKTFTKTERQYFVELANNHPKIKHNTRIINDLMKEI